MTIAAINRYDATTALKKIASGTFTATDYLKACLDRIAEREEDVGPLLTSLPSGRWCKPQTPTRGHFRVRSTAFRSRSKTL